MNKDVNYLILKSSIVVNHMGGTCTVNDTDSKYQPALDAIRAGDMDALLRVVDIETSIAEYVPKGEFAIHNGAVYSGGERVGGYIESRLLEFHENNLPYNFLLNFWKRLRKNPSENSKHQLYRFLEAHKCPLTPRGTFIAYKSVIATKKPNVYVSHHDRKFEYTLEEPAQMARDGISDDPATACGTGLHVGSYGYAESFGSGSSGAVLLEVEVDPANVVSVPSDCSSGKVRCCEVLPLAILVGGAYKTAIVDEDEGHEDDVCETAETAGTVDVTETVTINRKMYKHMPSSADMFAAIESSSATRIRASKAPKAIRKFCNIEQCYRVEGLDNTSPMYYVKAVGVDGDEYYEFMPITETEFEAMSLPEVEAEVVVEVDEPAVVEIRTAPEVENPRVIFNGAEHVVDSIEDYEFNAAILACTKIRPSKMPAFAKEMDAELCYRDDIIFYLKVADKYYKVYPA